MAFNQYDGNEVMRITDGSNVGIGTTSPARKLHVVEGSNGYAARFEDGIELDGTNVQLLGYGQGNLWMMGNSGDPKLTLGYSHNWDFAVSFKYTKSSTPYSGLSELHIGQLDKNNTNWDHGVTSFYVSGSEAMRLNKDGYLGIGTTSPAFALDVNGDIRIEDAHYLRFGDDDSDSQWAIQHAGADLNFAEVGVADNVLFLEAGGDVGIGTNAPNKKLHVAGTTRLSGNTIIGTESGNDLICRFIQGRNSGADTAGSLYLQYGNSNHVFIGNSSTASALNNYGDLLIYSGSTEWYHADTSAKQIDVTGTFNVDGTISATAKSFNIEHPLYKDKRLVHGSLEGPEHGIYIRGTIEASTDCEIELPDYWEAMCEDYTVQLTPHGPYTVFIKEKQKGKVMVASSNKDYLESDYKFAYYIVGSRTDETLEVVQDG